MCPLSVRASAPVRASQTLAVSSQLAVAMREPSGLNDAEVHVVGVPLEREDLGAAPGVPDPRRVVLARGGDARAVRAPRDRGHDDRCGP